MTLKLELGVKSAILIEDLRFSILYRNCYSNIVFTERLIIKIAEEQRKQGSRGEGFDNSTDKQTVKKAPPIESAMNLQES